MKRITRFRTVSAILLLLVACETDPRLLSSDFYAVRFTDTGITLKESHTQTVRIQVHNAGPALDEPVTITYAISGSAREGVDYTIAGDERSITIPAREYFGYIEVNLINNANNILRTQNIVFTLQLVDHRDVLSVGQGPGAIGKTFTMNIQDDCILGGTYSASKGLFSVPVEGISIISTDCETYTLSNWNYDYLRRSLPYEFTLTFTDNNDNTLTITEQDSDEVTISGSGVVDPVTHKIKIVLTILEPDETPQTVEFTLTPEQ